MLAMSTLLWADAPQDQTRGNDKSESWVIEPDESLPNVLILGDSISIGYTLEVRKQLAGKANVFRPAIGTVEKSKPFNCQGTTNGIKKVDRWLAGRKWDVIHFNFGLHDLKHVDQETGGNSSLETDPQQAKPALYEKQLREIVEKLAATKAQLIFATTTPIAPNTTKPLRKPEYPIEYNRVALEVLKPYNVEINDLHALCEPVLLSIQKPRNCHFKEEGYKMLATQVAKKIAEAL